VFVIGTFALYALYQNTSGAPSTYVAATTADTAPANILPTTSSVPSTPIPNPVPQTVVPPPIPKPKPKSTPPKTAGSYKDGSYTGTTADAYYGYVEVKAIVKNGRLADVQFLSYPQDARHSFQLSQMAMPILKSEAIRAQSAKVNIVSGATDTSRAFQVSLASALSEAAA